MKNHRTKLQNRLAMLAIAVSVLAATQIAVRAGDNAADIWTQLADMPTARRNLATCVVDGKIYAIGGVGAFRKVEQYDPATDAWTEKADMATPRAYFGVGVVNGKIYAMGGSTSTSGGANASVEEYDPVKDTWTMKNDMPMANSFHTTCVVNGKIYSIGGYPGSTPFSNVYEFDPVANTWTEKSWMPTARGLAHLGVVDGKIYAFGGLTAAWGANSSVEEYDPVKDTWTVKSSMPLPSTARTSTVDGKIYTFGGIAQKGGDPLSGVFQYDPATDTWTGKEDMPFRNSSFSTIAVDGSTYAIGGSSASWPYDPSIASAWKLSPFIPSIKASGITLESSESVRIEFKSTAPTTIFDFFLETNVGLSDPWTETAAEMFTTPDGYYFQYSRTLAQKQMYFRVGARTKTQPQ